MIPRLRAARAQMRIRAMQITRGWCVALVPVVLVLSACNRAIEVPAGGPIAGWPEYGGTAGGTRHSPLTQITPENVGALEVAWIHHSGDIEDGSHGMGMRSSYQVTPILVGDTLYICTPFNRVIAL